MSVLKLDHLIDKITDYFRVKLDIIKLDAVEQGSAFIIRLIALLLLGTLSLLTLIFLAIGTAIALNYYFTNGYSGYFIVAGLFALLMIGFWFLFKNGVLQNILAKLILGK